jgi:hypothetical protein
MGGKETGVRSQNPVSIEHREKLAAGKWAAGRKNILYKEVSPRAASWILASGQTGITPSYPLEYEILKLSNRAQT